jgi:hypothetical protein
MKNTTWQNSAIDIKVKLASLWAAVMCCYIYGDYFSFYVPNNLEKFLSGQTMLDTPFKLFAASVLMAVPSVMIFLSIALRAPINRWLNIVFGVFYTCIMVLIAFVSIAPWWTFYVFLAIVEAVLTSLIVWYAWNWPKDSTNSISN